jgi:glycosyltransferase involved in cell wall biosynthesis
MKATEKQDNRACIVVSGVNLTQMGPLSVFKDALSSLTEQFGERYEITALVHRRELLGVPNVTYLEFPEVKSSWFKRVAFEYHRCKRISARIRPDLWISMDNMTPNVTAKIRAVYCHNPSPFYKFRLNDLQLDWKFGLFTLFYRYLYAINIKRNDYVIVQQDWIRQRFKCLYGVDSVIVAHPAVTEVPSLQKCTEECSRRPYSFFYPAYPRTFKNLELVLEASRILEEQGFADFEIWLTSEISVNKYARGMATRYSGIQRVRWLGILPRREIFELYKTADCLLFPSKLETWGMPITEFKATGKPILAADLPYARETVGTYPRAAFFDPMNPEALASLMRDAATGKPIFARVQAKPIAAPFANNWAELWALLLSDAHVSAREITHH